MTVPRVRLFFAWYDLWIGAYYDRHARAWYVCLLPCLVLRIGPRPGAVPGRVGT